ncbi:integrase repeat-containing protein [Deinococcus apachensis]|uniref:integrase repeat-containing protein n=1 Tax=Deinococcus apachensis TaxID=309886 RepID=UPI001FE052C6|nr:integrase repeat-containing protein [Deinococcus apachensis]
MQLAQAQGYRTLAEYRACCHEIPGLPSNPDRDYPDFPGWGTFLGTGKARRKQRQALPFLEAQALARELGLKSRQDYMERLEQDDRLPHHPTSFPQWQGWEAFLGLEPQAFTYEDARHAVRELGIRTAREYHQRYREHPGLPSTPASVYPEWTTWSDFLGERPSRYLAYGEASRAARAAGIRTFREYASRYKEVPGLPSTPNQTYSEWEGWASFLAVDGG